VNTRSLSWLLTLFFITFTTALAQSYMGDARRIGMGGTGYSENLAVRMVEDERSYGSIVIPLGVLQMLFARDYYDPNRDKFDPVLTLEWAAMPLHYIVGRNPGGARTKFAADLLDGSLNRDLNTYRGFVPVNSLTLEGLASGDWGKTFKFHRGAGGEFQGIFVGAGPYISAKTALNIDKGLTDILASPTNVYVPNGRFPLTNSSFGQAAISITGGYRARYALPNGVGTGSDREGIYVGANFRYLLGFRYEGADMNFRLDTNPNGFVAVTPPTASPAAQIDYLEGRSGRGLALDFGVAAVVQQWEFSFGANGVGNRINWDKMRKKQLTSQSLVQPPGGEFDLDDLDVPYTGPLPFRVELPVEYTGHVAYQRGAWTAASEIAHGFEGTRFHAGLERKLGRFGLRGGAAHALDRWHPSGGVGLDLSERVSVDVALFGTTTNIERQLRPAVAVSLRLNHVR
jgi:hypothetical protein